MRKHAADIGLAPISLDDLDVLFGHDVPPDVWLAGAAHERPQSDTPFGEPWPLKSWPDVPIRLIVSTDDRLFPLEFQHRIARERLGLTPDEMPGGHLVALSRPAELAERIVQPGRRAQVASR